MTNWVGSTKTEEVRRALLKSHNERGHNSAKMGVGEALPL